MNGTAGKFRKEGQCCRREDDENKRTLSTKKFKKRFPTIRNPNGLELKGKKKINISLKNDLSKSRGKPSGHEAGCRLPCGAAGGRGHRGDTGLRGAAGGVWRSRRCRCHSALQKL